MSNELGSNLEVRKTPQRGKAPIGMPETVRILLEENDNIPPSGQFFGLNGKGYMLTPGVAANVPKGIVDILDNAVMSTPVIDPMTKQVIGYREKLRYPYRFMQSDAESAPDEE